MVLPLFPFSLLADLEEFLFDFLKPILLSYGGVGIAFGMFLESSIVPIPSELILITAGLFFDPVTVAFWGALGSTLGAIVGYWIGFYGGRPALDKIGPYIMVTPQKVLKAEEKFKKWGAWTVFVARLIPFIPFKVFSITSGILKFDFPSFVVMTFIGTIPRAFILASLGYAFLQYKTPFLIAFAAIVAVGIIAYLFLKKKEKTKRA